MIVRLSHPYKWHATRDVIDLDDDEARRLIRAGAAVDARDLIYNAGGGWFSVPLPAGEVVKVRGYENALAVLGGFAR